MARHRSLKAPYQRKGTRSSAASNSSRRSNPPYNRDAATITSRNSSVQMTAHSEPERPTARVRRGPFLDNTSLNTSSGSNEHTDENDDLLNEIIMAVDMTPRGRVGCCYYVASEERLYFMEDIQCGHVDAVDSCKCCTDWHAAVLLTMLSEGIH